MRVCPPLREHLSPSYIIYATIETNLSLKCFLGHFASLGRICMNHRGSLGEARGVVQQKLLGVLKAILLLRVD